MQKDADMQRTKEQQDPEKQEEASEQEQEEDITKSPVNDTKNTSDKIMANNADKNDDIVEPDEDYDQNDITMVR